MNTRREFLIKSGLASMAMSLGLPSLSSSTQLSPFKISLAQWSVNRPLFEGELDHLDFPVLTKKHGIDAVEYVNQFFMDKAKDKEYLKEMNRICNSEGVDQVLIMCDREGTLGARDEKERKQTVENHKKWVEAAAFLGCHSIRINAYTDVPWSPTAEDADEAMKLASDGLRQMCEFADEHAINVIIENHGGFSSNAYWLRDMIQKADHPRAGSLPDFGNFVIHRDGGNLVTFDSYLGVDILMPMAKGVSLKTTTYDNHGNQSPLDYERMFKIVLSHGYNSWVGIEYGEKGREWESIVEVREKLEELKVNLGY